LYAERVASAIEHTPDLDVVFVQAVADGEGKAFRLRAVMAEMLFFRRSQDDTA
jgi:hypothetical protein